MTAFALPTVSSSDPLPPPFYSVPPLLNLRVVSGYPTSTGGTISPRILYRCADPSNVPLEGILKLNKDLGIGRIFDLRSGPEIINAGGVQDWVDRLEEFNKEGNGVVKREWTPVFKDEDYSPDKVALRFVEYAKNGVQGFVNAYTSILSNGGPCYGTILRYLASLPETGNAEGTNGAIIHCTAGKDRTGCFYAILLSLLGVPDDIIASEYALTELGMAEMLPVFVERLMENEEFLKLNGTREGAERMVGSRKENMLATLVMIREKFGGAEKYVREVCGLTEEQVTSLKRNLVESGKTAQL